MKQQRHWLDNGPSAIGARLLNAASREALPEGALQRAGKRLGFPAALVSAASITSAGSASAETVLGTTTAVAGGKLTSAGLLLTLTKAVGLGLLTGGLMVGTARWAMPSRGETAGARSPVASAIRVHATLASVASSGDTTTSERDAAEAVRNVDEAVPSGTTSGEREGVTALRDAGALNGVGAERQSLAANASRRTELVPQSGTQGLATPPNEFQSTEKLNHLPTSDRTQTARVARFGDDVQPVPAASARTLTTPTSVSIVPPEPPTKRSALAAEVRAIDSVRLAVHSGEFQRALEELAQGERAGTFVSLRVEAAVLRVQALDGAGRVTEATILARRLLSGSLSPSQRQKLEEWLARHDKE